MSVQPGEISDDYQSPYAGYGGYGPSTAEYGAAYGSMGVAVPMNVVPQAQGYVMRQSPDYTQALQEMEQSEVIRKQNAAAAQRLQRDPLRVDGIKFNPPIIRYASGAQSIASPTDRRLIFTAANQRERVLRKGFFIPDISHAENDWYSGSASGTDPSSSSFDYTTLDYPFEGARGRGAATIYGFKFMYNPAVLDFGISSTDGVNLGYIASGKSTAMPTGATSTGSSIGLSFPITRIDDISLIQSSEVAVRNEHYQRALDKWVEAGRVGQAPQVNETIKSYAMKNLIETYGRRGDKKVTEEDLRNIAERGTMYDLEFLFRAVLGRRWKTLYRGYTADVGLMFGVPLKLVLSNKMIYRVRLSNVSFSHKSFTPDMVPMYTDVALTFDRIPDVVGYE